jgi:hypothetical protein
MKELHEIPLTDLCNEMGENVCPCGIAGDSKTANCDDCLIDKVSWLSEDFYRRDLPPIGYVLELLEAVEDVEESR